MTSILRLLLLVGLLAGRLFAQNFGTTNTFNVTASAPGVPTFTWVANDAPQVNTSNGLQFALTSSTKNGSLKVTITNHGGQTLTANQVGFNIPFYTWYEDGVEKQSGNSASYTPASSTVTVVLRVDALEFTMIAATGSAVNVWAPIAQGQAGTTKRIQLAKYAELAAVSGAVIKWRVNGGTIASSSSNVTVNMPNGTATLEYWAEAPGWAESVHQTTSWNELMI